MNKLNPIYIIVLSFIILFIVYFMLNEKKEEYHSKVVQLNNIKANSKEYLEYKSKWNNKKFIEKTVEEIVSNRIFENEKILKVSTSNVLKVKINSSNQKVLNSFLNKILNKKLLINKIQIEKDFINLEIGLKI